MTKWQKVCKLVADIVFYLVFVVVIICAGNILFNKFVYQEKAPRLFNYYAFEVMSGSMSPTIEVDDYIVIEKTNQYEVGDIVSYYYGDDDVVTHRIVDIEGDAIITKGDANNSIDTPISENQIIGEFASKAPFIGFIIEYRFVILGMIIILFVAWQVLWYYLRRGEKEIIKKEDKHEKE